MSASLWRSVTRTLLLTVALALGFDGVARADLAPPLLSDPQRIAGDPAAASRVVTLDFDGDGIPDLATVGPNRVRLVGGLPDGWAEPQTLALSLGPGVTIVDVAAGDVTGDGLDDIVLSTSDGRILVIRGRDDEVLTAPEAADVYPLASTDMPVYGGPLDLGDVDGDGSLDVVAGFGVGFGFITSAIGVLVNDGNGHLIAAPSLPSTALPAELQLVQLGGDGDLDLVAAEGSVDSLEVVGGKARISVRPGGPGATFGSATSYDYPGGSALDVAAGGFTGDGATDVVVGRATLIGGPRPAPLLLTGAADSPALSAPVVLTSAPYDSGSSVEAADLDRDGVDDFAILDGESYGITVMRSTGAGAFAPAGGPYQFPHRITGWTLGDADGDGKVDLIALVESAAGSEIQIYYGAGPQLQPRDAVVDFGNVQIGAQSGPSAGAFTNAGPGDADTPALLADGDLSDFKIVQDTCAGATLAVGDTCAVSARFTPTTAGDRELDVAVVAPDSDEAFWLAFTGTGVVAPAPAAKPTPQPTPAPTPAPTAAPPATVLRATLARARAPRITGRGRSARLDTGWRATCPGTGAGCRVDVLTVARGRRGHRAPVLARGHVTLRAGAAAEVAVALTPAGHRMLAHGKVVRAVMQLSAGPPGTAATVVTRDVRLRRR